MRKASVAATPSIAEEGGRGWTDERLLAGDSDLEVSRADGLTDRREFEDGDEEGGRKGREKEGRKKRRR